MIMTLKNSPLMWMQRYYCRLGSFSFICHLFIMPVGLDLAALNGGTSQCRCMNMVLNNCLLMWMQRFKEENIGELCDLVVESTGLGSERSWV